MKKGFVWKALVSLFAIGIMVVPALAGEKAMTEQSFVKDAASGGMMEVELGQMAKEKAKSQEVKDFAQRMVTDHGKANQELKSVMGSKMQLPTKMASKHKKMVDKFADLSGEEFDKKYAKEMVKDHKKDVAKFRKASKKVKDPDLKGWVDKTLPVLEQHLKHAKEMAKNLGVTVK